MAAQAVGGVAVFLSTMYLAKTLPPSVFALYSTEFVSLFFLSGLLSAIHTTGVVLCDITSGSNARSRYFARELWGLFRWDRLLIVTTLSAAVQLIIILTWRPNEFQIDAVVVYFALLPVAAFAVSLRDYLIRYAYAVKLQKELLGSQLAFAVIYFLVLLLVTHLPSEWHGPGAILGYGISSAFFFVLTTHRSKLLALIITSRRQKSKIGSLRKFLESGRNGAVAHLIISLRSQLYVYVTPILSAASVLAEVNAARMVFTPASIVIPVMAQMFMAKIISEKIRGRALIRYGLLEGCASFIVVGTMGITFIALLRWKYSVLVNENYKDVIGLGFFWLFFGLLTAMKSITESAVMVQSGTKMQVTANLAGMVIGTAALIFTVQFGPIGVMVSLLMSEAVVTALYLKEVARWR